MKKIFLPIFLSVVSIYQVGAFPWGKSSDDSNNKPKVTVKVVNKSKYDLKNVKFLPTKVVKFGIKQKGSINVEGHDVPVVLPAIGTPHGVKFDNIGKTTLNRSKSKKVEMKRFDVNRISVTYKGRGTGRLGKNVTKYFRTGRLKFDCIYWSGGLKKGVKRSHAYKSIDEVVITVYDNKVSVSVIAGPRSNVS